MNSLTHACMDNNGLKNNDDDDDDGDMIMICYSILFL